MGAEFKNDFQVQTEKICTTDKHDLEGPRVSAEIENTFQELLIVTT